MIGSKKLKLYTIRISILFVIGTVAALAFFPLPRFISDASIDVSLPEKYVLQVKDEDLKEEVVAQVKGAKFLAQSAQELKNDFEAEEREWVSIPLKKIELEKAKSNPNIVKIERDLPRKPFNTPPNDTLFNSEQWNLPMVGLSTKAASTPPLGSAISGWDVTTGSASTVIAVIDTGIDLNHPDLQNNVWINTDEIAGNGIDDDNNGYVDDRNGYDFSCDDNNGDNDCSDPGDSPSNGNVYDAGDHGSHVSGIAGAVTNNAQGIAGICWNCKIMPLKVINSFGWGYDSDIAVAIEYAADNGAKVINLSLGGGGHSSNLQDAIDYATNSRDVVVVAATGNGGANGDTASDSYPGGMNNVIAVGATNSSDVINTFTNRGPKIDVTAPGSDIASTIACSGENGGCNGGNSYGYLDGTSMASPHVAGIAALLRSYYPSWTAKQVRYAILKNLDDKGSAGFDNDYGFGRANALKALQASSQLAADAINPVASLTQPGTTVSGTFNLQGTASDANLYIYTINIIKDYGWYTSVIRQFSGRSNVTNGTLYSINTAETKMNYDTGVAYRTMPDGAYTVEMRVEDYAGNAVTTSSINITINNVFPSAFTTTGPENDTWTSDQTPTFTWNTSTDTSSAVTYDLYLNDAVYASNINTTTYTPSSNLSNGTYNWKIGAKNASGNTTFSNTAIIKIDATAPNAFSIVTNVDRYYATLTFTATDTHSSIKKYTAVVDGGTEVDVVSPFTAGPLENGAHSIVIKAYDQANNTTSTTSNFSVSVTDQVSPSAILVQQASTYVKGNYQFIGTATDENIAIRNYNIYIQRKSDSVEYGFLTGTAPVNNGVLGTFNTATIPDGEYKVIMIVKDYANNIGASNEILFTVDNAPPASFNLTSPTYGATLGIDKPTFTWVGTSDNFTAVKYDLYINGGIYAGGLTTTSFTATSIIPDGTHSWQVVAKDDVGNTRTTPLYVFNINKRQMFLKSKADFDGNSKVDLSDLSILAQNWGKNTSSGDTNGDGKIDLTDLSILAENWQKSF